MQRQKTLVVGRCSDMRRWIELRLDEHGQCSVVLASEHMPSNGGFRFPCSYANLRLVGQGMTYQANTNEGYVTMSSSNGCLKIFARHDSDSTTWSCQMPLSEFLEGIDRIDEALYAQPRSYVA